MKRIHVLAVSLTGAALLLSACGGTTVSASGPAPTSATSTPAPTETGASAPSSTEAPVPTEAPAPTESNPPGDIPDNVAFVPFTTKSGVTVSTPEGWARTTTPSSVTFTDKLNTVVVSWEKGSQPTVASAKSQDVKALAASTRAFHLVSVSTATLPAGPAVVITYQANSEPNSVTGKQYRLDVVRYELFHAGQRVSLTLLSPVGSDNVDPWRIVTESLSWK